MSINIEKNIVTALRLLLYFAVFLGLLFTTTQVFAAEADIGKVAKTIRSSLQNVASLLTAMAYVSGIAFAMMGLLKFKAHKDNPTQTALSVPITLLVIAAGLVFLPSVISTAGSTIWGTEKSATGTSGGSHEKAQILKGTRGGN